MRDYYLGKGGYAYIHRQGGEVVSLHYVQEQEISVLKSPDPIFKDFDLGSGRDTVPALQLFEGAAQHSGWRHRRTFDHGKLQTD